MSDHQPSWMPSDETLRATAHNCTLYATCNRQDPMEDLRDVIEEAVEKAVRAHDHERFHQYLLDMRWIDGELCSDCGGGGVKAYSSTATWHGGIGGQAITGAVCDKCWGSGNAAKPWLNLRSLKTDQEQAVRVAVEKALAEQEARHRCEVIEAEVRRYESVLRGLRSEEQTPQVLAIIESVDADAERYRTELAALEVKP